MSTVAMPGTRSRRSRIFQYAIADMSMMSTVSERSPISIVRLVEESAGMIHGGLAQVGMFGSTSPTRSWTSCRARFSLVPFSNTSLIDDSCATDFDCSRARPGMPLRASSIGTVISDSTSDVELPSAIVWICTWGSENSGKASTLAPGTSDMPSAMIPSATNRTIQWYLRLRETIQRIMRSHRIPAGCRRRAPGGRHW